MHILYCFIKRCYLHSLVHFADVFTILYTVYCHSLDYSNKTENKRMEEEVNMRALDVT